jgi:hypothetical protein
LSAIAAGFAAGGIQGGNIESALQGAFFPGITFGLASEFGLHFRAGFLDSKNLGQIALHAALGCGQAAAGGTCKSGVIAGGFSAAAGPLLPGAESRGFDARQLIGQAAVGAVAARLSGGSAQNGAVSAAFGYLFNNAVLNLLQSLYVTGTRIAIQWGPTLAELLEGLATGGPGSSFGGLSRSAAREVIETALAGTKEGVYVFKAKNGFWYVGQSGNLAERLMQHIASGKLSPADLGSVRFSEVAGAERLGRNIVEQFGIEEYRRIHGPIANVINAIGQSRVQYYDAAREALLNQIPR